MPLQKSFSDTNHSAKRQKQSWNKNRSFQGQASSKSEAQPKPLRERPPVAVSSTTKNKLSAFQFRGQPAADATTEKTVVSLLSEDEKENEHRIDAELPPAENRTRIEEIRHLPSPSLPEQVIIAISSDPLQTIDPKKSLPSTPTPVGRLAMPDLIGMEDVRRTLCEMTPEDQIKWDQPSSSSAYRIRRARKRARSSSPLTSSPVPYVSALHQHATEPSNSQADPGSELWGRYSMNGSGDSTPQGPQILALTHIMYTSSPQASREGTTPRSVAGFRRTTSCGVQFPKRKRVGPCEETEIVTEAAKIGPSKLSVLIERVQEGLSQPRAILVDTETSKAPVRHQQSSCDQQSPSSRFHHSTRNGQPDCTTTPELAAIDEEVTVGSNGSDYGDFDDDDLNVTSVFDALITQGEDITSGIPKQSNSQLPLERNLQEEACSTNTAQQHRPKMSVNSTEEADEFDDSDEELFAAGLNDMVDNFETQSQVVGVTQALKVGSNTCSTHPGAAASKIESDDEFGDDGLDEVDFHIAELASTQSIQHISNSFIPPTNKARAIQRYLVTNVVESEYTTSSGRVQQEKILFLQIENTKVTKTVNLRGTWFDTPVINKAFVHVIGQFEPCGRCVIDDAANILILHPDHLISSTVVADSFGCTRRAVLQDRVKATGESSPPLVYGTILHEIFQAAMLANRWDTNWLHDRIDIIAKAHLEDLYTIKLQVEQAVEYLRSKMGELQSWAELFVSSHVKPDAIVEAGNGEKANMCVSKLLDVEEHVWSPMYGLKGNIDATVQVTMKDQKEQRVLIVPFEVKTGKNPSAAHRAQTALYNLLLSDRYDVEVAYGILYYMETSQTIRIPAIRNELRHMIMQRNELACFVRERHAQLPPMLKKENMCNRCYAKVPCFIYHKLADDGTGETSGMKEKFNDVVKHLTPTHKEFFLKWDDLLTKEEKETLKFRRELWTMLSSEREKNGRCFSNVIIEPGSANEEKDNPKINRYHYTLIKQKPTSGFSFLESQIVVGEPIVISDEKGHFALANGYVTNVRKHRIAVQVDRRLHNARIRGPGFDDANNQVFASIMEVAPEGATAEESAGKIIEEPVQYRLDKDEFSNGMATARNNIIQVMSEGPFGSREIRSLVVDLKAPRFKTSSTAYTLTDRENINVDQRRAIQKVMSAQDYALVLGMPGTGKTTTIAHIIRALVSQGKSVLLTSFTHTAVDNILLKLKDDKIPILRIGNISKINSDVQEFATLAVTKKDSFEEIRSTWHDSPIVATTCLGINHPLFNERTFDYCIVDEASQITLPVCIGPIRLARTFILVGDHNQLPPLVVNDEARTGGLDISLFKHLSDAHPSSVVYLEHQYRMCEDVMALSNNLIYNGRLKCGSKEVAKRSISIPDMDALKQHHHNPSTISSGAKAVCLGAVPGSCWIRDLLDPETKVSFINTDSLLPGAREQDKGKRIVNYTEAVICTQLVESLLTVGVPATSIGVMTHYRSQLSTLKDQLRAHPGVEMHTADRFQGRDKEVIVLSLVRSNDAHSIGELLKDWRRINVAFTRAKTKLLVIGSRETLKGNGPKADGSEEMVAKFVGLMESKGWVYDLPSGALESHVFDIGATQVTASAVSKTVGTQLPMKNEQVKHDGGSGVRSEGRQQPETSKRKALGDGNGRENVGRMRQPVKRVTGQKPFKIPRQSVLADIYNEAVL